MRDVFISYHEKSAEELPPRIASALQSAGISCWYAPPNEPLTVPFTEEIVQAIEDCKVFLLILNEQAVHSVRVATETALVVRGFDDGKTRKLIAFRTDNCDVSADPRMSAFLKGFQIVDGCPPNAERIFNLKRKISLNLAPKIAVGDIVRIRVMKKDGYHKRAQTFTGVVIAQTEETVTVRRIAYGAGIEKTFFLGSLSPDAVQVVRQGTVRRDKLYYLRERVGKRVKL